MQRALVAHARRVRTPRPAPSLADRAKEIVCRNASLVYWLGSLPFKQGNGDRYPGDARRTFSESGDRAGLKSPTARIETEDVHQSERSLVVRHLFREQDDARSTRVAPTHRDVTAMEAVSLWKREYAGSSPVIPTHGAVVLANRYGCDPCRGVRFPAAPQRFDLLDAPHTNHSKERFAQYGVVCGVRPQGAGFEKNERGAPRRSKQFLSSDGFRRQLS